jgi:hypothetical protein
MSKLRDYQTRAVDTVRPAPRPCRLVEWKPWPFDNPSLIGHCTIAFMGGWVVHEIPVFRSADGISVGTPTMVQLDSEGRAKVLPNGKRDYKSAISFETKDARQRWRNTILAALEAGGIGAP